MFNEWPAASEMMTSDPITVDSGETISQALGLMHSRRVHEIPVTSKGRLVGLLAYDSIGRRHNLSLTTKVEHMMSIAPTLPPRALYPDVAERMLSSESRAVCIVNPRDGKLLGIVSRTDLTRAAQKLPPISQAPVTESMNPVTTVFREKDKCNTIFAVIKVLEEHPVPVIDSKMRLVGSVGIEEMGDAFWRPMAQGHRDMGENHPAGEALIGSIMRPQPPVVSEKASMGECARIMTRQNSYSVFVVDDSKPLGVICQTDILSLAVQQRRSIEGAYVQISGMGPATDPTLLADLDRVLSGGLKRIAHMENPLMLTLHMTPHSSHRLADISVQARLYTEGGNLYYAARTDWNLMNSVADLMGELERQVRKEKTLVKTRSRAVSTRRMPPSSTEFSGEEELENRLRDTLWDRSNPRKKKDTRRT
jgi:CBS domain-containing protein/ribosome-associated translation inhibitor RaiA